MKAQSFNDEPHAKSFENQVDCLAGLTSELRRKLDHGSGIRNAQAQHQSDVTAVNFPGAITPFKDTYDANVGARLRLFDPSRPARTAAERAQESEAEARLAAALHAQRQAVNDAFFQALLLDAQRAVLADAITDLEAQRRLAVSPGCTRPKRDA